MSELDWVINKLISLCRQLPTDVVNYLLKSLYQFSPFFWCVYVFRWIEKRGSWSLLGTKIMMIGPIVHKLRDVRNRYKYDRALKMNFKKYFSGIFFHTFYTGLVLEKESRCA